MGIIRCDETAQVHSLGPRCLIGRLSVAHLQLRTSEASAEHASIYFRGEWKLRDLASKNGTFLNGERLRERVSAPLKEGDTIGFGSLTAGWRLEDGSPPGPSALGPDGNRVHGDGTSLWLPSAESPSAVVIEQGEQWLLESGEEPHLVTHNQVVELDNLAWKLELPPIQDRDVDSTHRVDPSENRELQFFFKVSRDEEHVNLTVEHRGTRINLGDKVHNYALLVLARCRLQTADKSPNDSESGWVYAEQLASDIGLDRTTLNLHLWRARKSFKAAQLPADLLIERRKDTNQLRLGSGSLRITAGL